MELTVPQLLGMVVACGAAALSLILPTQARRAIAGTVALVAAGCLMLGQVWHDERLAGFWSGGVGNYLGIAAAIAGFVALTVVFARRPGVFPLLALATIALRVPIDLSGEQVNLLVPLYVVIASGVIGRLWTTLAGTGNLPRLREPRPVRWLRIVLAVVMMLYVVQSPYSIDADKAIETACFFLVPFAVLFTLLADIDWSRSVLAWSLRAVVAVGLVAALAGIYQFIVRDLWLNPELLEANQIHMYFRVNSIFYDPNIFARYLALVITTLGAVLIYMRRRSILLPAFLVALVMLVALGMTLSLSGALALLAGLIVVIGVRFGFLRMALTAAVVGIALFGFLALGGAERSHVGPDRGIEAETGGREDLFQGGVKLGAAKPLTGWGSGSFGLAFAREIEAAKTTVSHTEPVTAWAEQGIPGTLAYIALMVVSIWLVVAVGVKYGARRGTFSRRRRPRRLQGAAAAAIAGCYVAIIAHSLVYANFLTDPATWALLALASGMLSRGLGVRAYPNGRRVADNGDRPPPVTAEGGTA